MSEDSEEVRGIRLPLRSGRLTHTSESPSPWRGFFASRNVSSIVNRPPDIATIWLAVRSVRIVATHQGSFMSLAFTVTMPATG